MEINCILKDLADKLQNLFALNKSASREIMSHVLLVADDNVTLTATDGKIQGTALLGAKVVTAGKVLLPPESLGFLKALKSTKAPVNLKLVGTTLTITVGQSAVEFSVADLSQYPEPLPYFATPHKVESKNFLQALKVLVSLSGKAPYDRIYLRGDGAKLVMGTTDNFRLAFFEMPCDLALSEAALHAPILGPLQALGDDKQINLGYDSRTLCLACADYQFLVALLSADTPTNVLKFYDMPSAKGIDAGQLQQKAKAANAIADVLTLDLSGKITAFNARSNYEDSFDAVGSGEFVVNISHLLGALSMPMDKPLMGIKKIGPRNLLAIRDQNMQQYLIPLETK